MVYAVAYKQPPVICSIRIMSLTPKTIFCVKFKGNSRTNRVAQNDPRRSGRNRLHTQEQYCDNKGLGGVICEATQSQIQRTAASEKFTNAQAAIAQVVPQGTVLRITLLSVNINFLPRFRGELITTLLNYMKMYICSAQLMRPKIGVGAKDMHFNAVI